jgi:REP element-mobilizing transposase RayT
MESSPPLAYFLTWVTYGSWLHGDERGSIDREHNTPGTPRKPTDRGLEDHRRRQLMHDPVVLSDAMRTMVDAAIVEVCEHREWTLLAVNVRTNHVHVVVTAEAPSDNVLRDFKAYATRRLRRGGLVTADGKVWADGGSQRQLWKQWNVESAVNYTLHGQ